MSIHISRTKTGTTMRVTGKDAQALFDLFAGKAKPQPDAEPLKTINEHVHKQDGEDGEESKVTA